MRRKHLLQLTLIIAMMLCFTAPVMALDNADLGLDAFKKQYTYEQEQFADVSAEAWYAENVASVFEYGLMIGKSDDRFDPEGNITVAEAITVAARLHKIYHTGSDDFEQTTPWYQSYVDYADANGMTILWRSDSELEADLNDPASRNTFVLLMSLALQDDVFPQINEVEYGAILDVWSYISYDHIYSMYRAGVLNGKDDKGNFGMMDDVKRSETAAIITRIVDVNLRLQFTLMLPQYPTQNQWIGPGTYRVGVDIPATLYYVKPFDGEKASYRVFRYSRAGQESPVTSNSYIGTYDFIRVHNTEYLVIEGGMAIAASNIPPIQPQNGRYGNGKYRVGVDIPAGTYQVYVAQEGKLGEYIVFSGSRAHGQGGLLDMSTVVDFYIWDTGYREVTLREGNVLCLGDSYIPIS